MSFVGSAIPVCFQHEGKNIWYKSNSEGHRAWYCGKGDTGHISPLIACTNTYACDHIKTQVQLALMRGDRSLYQGLDSNPALTETEVEEELTEIQSDTDYKESVELSPRNSSPPQATEKTWKRKSWEFFYAPHYESCGKTVFKIVMWILSASLILPLIIFGVSHYLDQLDSQNARQITTQLD